MRFLKKVHLLYECQCDIDASFVVKTVFAAATKTGKFACGTVESLVCYSGLVYTCSR